MNPLRSEETNGLLGPAGGSDRVCKGRSSEISDQGNSSTQERSDDRGLHSDYSFRGRFIGGGKNFFLTTPFVCVWPYPPLVSLARPQFFYKTEALVFCGKHYSNLTFMIRLIHECHVISAIKHAFTLLRAYYVLRGAGVFDEPDGCCGSH